MLIYSFFLTFTQDWNERLYIIKSKIFLEKGKVKTYVYRMSQAYSIDFASVDCSNCSRLAADIHI